MLLRLGLLGPRLGRDGPGMGPVGDEVILSNFPHALMCVEDAQAKCFGLKERELVPALKGDLNQPPTAIPAMLSTLLFPFQLVPGFRPLLSGFGFRGAAYNFSIFFPGPGTPKM